MLYAYKQGSNSAKALAQTLGIKQIKHEGSKFKGNPSKIVINWGASQVNPEVEKCTIINHPSAVKRATNKLSFFKHVDGELNIPDFTTDKSVAEGWLDDGYDVFARETLTGHSGKGIVHFADMAELKNYTIKAPMYVKYIPKKQEFRVHVVNGKVIDVRRKALKKEHQGKPYINWKVRNLANGFIYAIEDCHPDQKVLDEAIKTIDICNLEFGAVDVIWNEVQQKAYVLEVNTAPGLEGSTIENYKKAFEELFYVDQNKALKAKEAFEAVFVNHTPAWDLPPVKGVVVDEVWIDEEDEF